MTENNEARLKQLGLMITYYRKMHNWSQEQLAEYAGIGRTHLSKIEAPGIAYSFSLDCLFSLADALGVSPADLLKFPENS